MTEAEIDRIHTHERGGGLGIGNGSFAQASGLSIREDGSGQFRMANIISGCQRGAPSLCRIELLAREHTLGVDHEVAGFRGQSFKKDGCFLHIFSMAYAKMH